MASSSKTAPRPSQLNPKAAVDYAEILRTAGIRFCEFGMQPACFDPDKLLELGYTDDLAVKLLRPILNETDPVKVERILNIGVNAGFFYAVSGVKPLQLYTFLQWLKGAEGTRKMNQLAFQEKLARRAQKGLTASDVAWISMFDIQRNDVQNRSKEIRRDYEIKIAEAEAKVRQLRGEMEEALLHVREGFEPASEYVPLAVPEYNRRCWKQYLEERSKAGRSAPNVTRELLKAAVYAHGEYIKNMDVLSFLEVDDRKDELCSYIEKKAVKYL